MDLNFIFLPLPGSFDASQRRPSFNSTLWWNVAPPHPLAASRLASLTPCSGGEGNEQRVSALRIGRGGCCKAARNPYSIHRPRFLCQSSIESSGYSANFASPRPKFGFTQLTLYFSIRCTLEGGIGKIGRAHV